MDYSLTGGFLHELLGIVLLAGFIVHIAINREYYKAILRGIRSGKVSAKSKAGFAVDIILPISAVIMLISSLAISQDLFPGIAELFGGQFWMPVHIVCAVVLLISVFIHVCMHARLISAFIGQVTENAAVLKMKTAGMRMMALLFALLVVRSSFSSMADVANMLPAGDTGETEIDNGGNKQSNELIIEEARNRQNALGVSDSGYIFSADDNFLNYRSVSNAFYRYCDKAGIDYRSSHKARKTFISSLIDAGMNINTIREIVGHADEQTTWGSYCYDRRTKDERREILESAVNSKV